MAHFITQDGLKTTLDGVPDGENFGIIGSVDLRSPESVDLALAAGRQMNLTPGQMNDINQAAGRNRVKPLNLATA